MNQEKCIQFLKESFLSPLLFDENVTDISYNGEELFFMNNITGREKSDISINENSARDFIRQLANLSEKQFSYQSPELDISIGIYRINAVHPSIGRKNGEHCLTFSVRITKSSPVINSESNFLNVYLNSLLLILILSKVSIVIGGLTGTGKTELQKHLIRIMEDSTRLIVIDNVLELDNLELSNLLDINIWQADERNGYATIQNLVRNALRCNPDWLIVAESRGKEMVEVLNSALTGHPIITTLHALDINSMPMRMARMVMMNNQNQDFKMVLEDIYYIFRFYIYLNIDIKPDKSIHRHIEEVAYFDVSGQKHKIYENKNGRIKTYKIIPEALKLLKYTNNKDFIKYFVEES